MSKQLFLIFSFLMTFSSIKVPKGKKNIRVSCHGFLSQLTQNLSKQQVLNFKDDFPISDYSQCHLRTEI